VLDIGSGWGGLGLYLAKDVRAGSGTQGVTLSTEQHAVATERAQAQGLENQVHFETQGLPRPRTSASTASSRSACSSMSVSTTTAPFSRMSRKLLKPDGVMLLHTIGRPVRRHPTSAFITQVHLPGRLHSRRFVGGDMPAIEKAGLIVTDIEILRLHYADTLQALERALRRQPRQGQGDLRRALLPDVGVLPRRCPKRPSAGRTCGGLPDPARQSQRHACQ
jgi:cyclopropane-fatty-acyl-phospholipid synthase